MAVYFVYRSHYDLPSGKHLRRFDDATVLDWFSDRWDYLVHGDGKPDESARARLRDLLGCHVYGLGSLFEAAAEEDVPAPESDEQLDACLHTHLYSEGPILYEPHCLTVQTDDDELEMAYYFFDDDYLRRHRARAAYLLHEDWRLPSGHAGGHFRPRRQPIDLSPAGTGEGATYLVFNAYYDSSNLSDLEGGHRIEGVRLPDLARYLAQNSPEDRHCPFELRLLRSQLLLPLPDLAPTEAGLLDALLDNPADEVTWAAYSDWLLDHEGKLLGQVLLERALAESRHCPVARLCNSLDLSFFGFEDVASARRHLKELIANPKCDRSHHDPVKSLIHVEEHLAQLCLHADRWGQHDLYHQWTFFDDLWASAHPDLADALLDYAATWDVLSTGGSREG